MAEELGELEITDRATILKHVPLFGDLREPELRNLAGLCSPGTYQPGQELYHQSDVTQKMFIIRNGQVALYAVDPQGEEALVGYRAGFDVFDATSGASFEGWLGEAAILLSDPHDVTALAMTVITTLEISREVLFDKKLGVWGRLTPLNRDTAERVKYLERKFKWLDKDEIVMRHVNQHPWALYRQMLIPLGILLALLAIFLLLSRMVPGISTAILLVLGLIPLAVTVIVFVDWRDDYYVVTNKRVMHLDVVPWGRQKREEAPLSNVQEIQISRLSIAAQLFDFGDLNVETFGGRVAMQYVPGPSELKAFIFGEKTRVLSRSRASTRRAIYKDLATRVGQMEKALERPVKPVQPTPPPSYRPGQLLRGVLRYFFPPAREQESNRVTYRTHWISLLQRGTIPFMGLVLSTFGTINWYVRGFPFGGLVPEAFWFIWPVLLIAFGGWSWWVFDDWRNDVYIITADRIIDIQRKPLLFRETRKEAALDKIQTLETNVPTALARLLRYGTVIVRVPGAAFELKNVRDPSSIQTEISRQVDQFKRNQAAAAERGRRTELTDWFAVYDQLRQGYRSTGMISNPSESKSDGAS